MIHIGKYNTEINDDHYIYFCIETDTKGIVVKAGWEDSFNGAIDKFINDYESANSRFVDLDTYLKANDYEVTDYTVLVECEALDQLKQTNPEYFI